MTDKHTRRLYNRFGELVREDELPEHLRVPDDPGTDAERVAQLESIAETLSRKLDAIASAATFAEAKTKVRDIDTGNALSDKRGA